jgi:type I restriction enzyme, S subunit
VSATCNGQLPQGWAWATIDQIASVVQYGSSAKTHEEQLGVPVLRMGNITAEGSLRLNELKFLPASHPEFPELLLADGDLLFNRTNSAELVGKSAVYRDNPSPCSFASYLIRVRTNATCDTGFLAYCLNSWIGRTWIKSVVSQQVGQANVSGSKLRAFVIPLPPVCEQRRLVAEIEKQFTRLEAGVGAVKRVQANLKRYRAAVLKAAVEGRLVPTEAELARREGRSYEPASELLARMVAQPLLAVSGSAQAGVPVPPKPKHKEPVAPETTGLPKLPEGWAWASVEQLTPSDRPCAYGVLQPGDDYPDGVPIVRVGDIENGRVHLDSLKKIDPKISSAYPRTKLRGGEVLITLVGAIGRTALVSSTLAGANTARAVGVIPLTPLVVPRWIEVWFRNPFKVLEMTGKAHEVARKTLNLEDVRSAPVAIPPLSEQSRIASEVERRLSVIDELEMQVEANLKRADRLRQAILKRAFEGKLVPQDPSDEPASMLLERIKDARARGGTATPGCAGASGIATLGRARKRSKGEKAQAGVPVPPPQD